MRKLRSLFMWWLGGLVLLWIILFILFFAWYIKMRNTTFSVEKKFGNHLSDLRNRPWFYLPYRIVFSAPMGLINGKNAYQYFYPGYKGIDYGYSTSTKELLFSIYGDIKNIERYEDGYKMVVKYDNNREISLYYDPFGTVNFAPLMLSWKRPSVQFYSYDSNNEPLQVGDAVWVVFRLVGEDADVKDPMNEVSRREIMTKQIMVLPSYKWLIQNFFK